MTTKKIPHPDHRKRAVRGSMGYRINCWVPPEWETDIKAAAKKAGAPSISEWVRRLILVGVTDAGP